MSDILSELARVKVLFQLRAIEAIIHGSASADTRPQGGDALAAPFTSGAVPKADAQPPEAS